MFCFGFFCWFFSWPSHKIPICTPSMLKNHYCWRSIPRKHLWLFLVHKQIYSGLALFRFLQQTQIKLRVKSEGNILYSAAYWSFTIFLWNIDVGVLNMHSRRIFICHKTWIKWIFCSLFLWEQVLLNKQSLNNILLFLILLIIIQYATLKEFQL